MPRARSPHHITEGSTEGPGWARGPLLRGHCLRKGRQASGGLSTHSLSCTEPLQGLHVSQRSSAHTTTSSPYRKPGRAQSFLLLRTRRSGQRFQSHHRPPLSVSALCTPHPCTPRCAQAPSAPMEPNPLPAPPSLWSQSIQVWPQEQTTSSKWQWSSTWKPLSPAPASWPKFSLLSAERAQILSTGLSLGSRTALKI